VLPVQLVATIKVIARVPIRIRIRRLNLQYCIAVVSFYYPQPVTRRQDVKLGDVPLKIKLSIGFTSILFPRNG